MILPSLFFIFCGPDQAVLRVGDSVQNRFMGQDFFVDVQCFQAVLHQAFGIIRIVDGKVRAVA